MPSELSLAVVGAAHANADGSNRRFEILLCAPGDPVELRPEPSNNADPHAIAVFSSRGVQIGYVTAERAPWIGSKMSAGADLRAVFQRAIDFGALVRVNLEGEDPILPSARKPRDEANREPDESGFWPDYIPPDD
ncbi:hypothetical protein HJG53_16890 [Sphingomonas sp. ID1715]|uniref:HIRAN domain-containing protein n=1 Tax=Sphingomonas sp. ID1715 TaxID=1656898 RepID=UPI0014889C83|nr:HIRAN domain-containing protein [Sphingomonas sp. ID1715]NNM78566.1 hypothetical protein [Sphingomonas sp. ID1715]